MLHSMNSDDAPQVNFPKEWECLFGTCHFWSLRRINCSYEVSPNRLHRDCQPQQLRLNIWTSSRRKKAGVFLTIRAPGMGKLHETATPLGGVSSMKSQAKKRVAAFLSWNAQPNFLREYGAIGRTCALVCKELSPLQRGCCLLMPFYTRHCFGAEN